VLLTEILAHGFTLLEELLIGFGELKAELLDMVLEVSAGERIHT
jgi:hypothetical protein